VTFEKLVKIMLEEDLRRWRMFLDGKTFPWDAPLYPSEHKVINRYKKKKTEIKIKKSARRNYKMN